MTNKQQECLMMIQKFDEFEEGFKKDPTNESLLEFFDIFGKAVSEGQYEVEQLKIFKERMIKLQDIFAQKREDLKERTAQAYARKNSLSQYIKTSHINRK